MLSIKMYKYVKVYTKNYVKVLELLHIVGVW